MKFGWWSPMQCRAEGFSVYSYTGSLGGIVHLAATATTSEPRPPCMYTDYYYVGPVGEELEFNPADEDIALQIKDVRRAWGKKFPIPPVKLPAPKVRKMKYIDLEL